MEIIRSRVFLAIAACLALAACTAPWATAPGGRQAATQQAATQQAGMNSIETAVGRAPEPEATAAPENSVFLPEAPSSGATATPGGQVYLPEALSERSTPAGDGTPAAPLAPAATQNSIYFPVVPVLAGVTVTPTLIPVDPHVVLQLSASTIQVGDALTVTGRVVDIGVPYYYLYVQDPDKPEGANLAKVTYENALELTGGMSKFLALVATKGSMSEVTFTLRGLRPGKVQLWINASGEIHLGYPGPAYWGGGGSGPVTITVKE